MQPSNGGSLWQQGGSVPDQAGEGLSPVSQTTGAGSLHWQASEYVHHEKNKLWFVILCGAALILMLVAIFLVKSITFAILIVVMTVTLAVFAIRPPRIMEYELSSHGIRINHNEFSYHDFRYFGIIQDGPLYSALLIPNKRFSPAVSIYFPADQGEEIVDILGSHLPMEEVRLDTIDKIVRQLRF